jgi:tRNA 2-thiouridine synthesizing protein A
MNTTTIDARGLSCPEPVLRVREAMERLEVTEIEVRLDNAAARENVLRLAASRKWLVQTDSDSDGEFRLVLRRPMP